MKIIENYEREDLEEGRTVGLGFAFLVKKDNEFHTVHAISPCKDYLNDIVASHTLGKRIIAHGLQHTMLDKPFKEDFCYLAIKCFDRENIEKALLTRNFIKVLNHIEKEKNIPLTTEEKTEDKETVVLKIAKDWVKYPYLISLYTSLIRYYIFIDNQDIKNYLKIPKFADKELEYNFSLFSENFNDFMKRKTPLKQDLTGFDAYQIHDAGILSGYKKML